MKSIIFLLLTSFLLLKQNSVAAQSEAEMKAWQNFMTPGEMHKMIATWDGTWSAEVTTFMDPSGPQKSSATVENKMVLNGLYQMSHYTGTMMGAPFEGYGTLAYDNGKKMFVNTWVDNMGSGVVFMTGKWNDKTKTLELKGTQTDPMTGSDAAIREEVKVVDADNQIMTMWGAGMDGKEMKFMEISMKRKM